MTERRSLLAEMRELAERAKAASRVLSRASTEQKNQALLRMAERIGDSRHAILEANRADLEEADRRGISEALRDRLLLDSSRLDGIVASIRETVGLPDPVGQPLASPSRRPNGLLVSRVRIPLGVILMIFEARPNVTVDAATLCVKSGNAVILRGGKDAQRTALALEQALRAGLLEAGLPADSAQVVPTTDRAATLALLSLEGQIDLAIPRGGQELIEFVRNHARVPVIQHFKGVCHLYVDAHADMEKASAICYNAKVQRPGVCNALETLLVHKEVAPSFFGAAAERLRQAGVELRGDERTCELVPWAIPAVPEDYDTEYLALKLSVRVVDSFEDALLHIERHGSYHTEAIVTEDRDAAARFLREVDASCVLWNASTRFNDGGELGLGAEIGISTTKLHAFGPMGLEALTSSKFVVIGDGHTRS